MDKQEKSEFTVRVIKGPYYEQAVKNTQAHLYRIIMRKMKEEQDRKSQNHITV